MVPFLVTMCYFAVYNNHAAPNQWSCSTLFALRSFSALRPFLSKESIATVVHVSFTPRLDCWNTWLSNVASDKLLRLSMCKILVVKNPKRDHINLFSNNSTAFPVFVCFFFLCIYNAHIHTHAHTHTRNHPHTPGHPFWLWPKFLKSCREVNRPPKFARGFTLITYTNTGYLSSAIVL